MEPDIDSPRNSAVGIDLARDEEDARALSLRWSARVSLTPRILFVNVFALAMLAGGFFYLDSYRSRIVDGRVTQSIREARLVAEAIVAVPQKQRPDLALKLAQDMGARLRIYDKDAKIIIDTRAMGLRNFVLQDPDKQDWQRLQRAFWTRSSTPWSGHRAHHSIASEPVEWRGPTCAPRVPSRRSPRRYGARPIARPSSPPPRPFRAAAW